MRKQFLPIQRVLGLVLVVLTLLGGARVMAQVTTSTISGTIIDAKGEGLPGATVVALHEPSGTRYGSITNPAGLYTIPGVRVGGPYRITVSFIGYKDEVIEGITANLGTAANVNVTLTDASSQLQEVVISSNRSDIFSSNRTGAATTLGREAIQTLPTLNRSINDFTRLTPQASGTSFGGQDNRLNNITVDGSYFNNSFGLQGQPGQRTGVAPISVDALEEVQINVAPFDVRQSNFTGAGINAVTRSGTNEVTGSAFYFRQNQNLIGKDAKSEKVAVNDFNKDIYGFRLGGPLIKNKLFFFVNGEFEKRTEPATTFLAARPGATGAQVTRVNASDLDQLSQFLQTNFNYATGPYENYNAKTYGNKFLARLDWNINDQNKFSIRYSQLVSGSDILISNSNSLGFGNRRTNLNSMSYQGSGYIQNEDNKSIIAELNSNFRGRFSNQLIFGYNYSQEDRGQQGGNFPLIDILNAGSNYISTGLDPFTPMNKLNYGSFQLQDNFTYYAGKHTLTAGISVQRIQSNNVFNSGSLGVYIFGSLDDFYKAANAYIANPNAPTSPVTINRFQYRYSLLPGGAEPLQVLKVLYPGAYIQDEFQVKPNFKITAGLRVDIASFGNTALRNPIIDTMKFRDDNGTTVQYRTDKLPNATPLWSPRFGFNWDVKNNKTTQIRGGTGIFTGNPPFVWISNQVGNNGVLTALVDRTNTTAFPFNPDASKALGTATATPTLDINVTDPKFKFPQVWKTNLAIDQRLPFGLVGSLEFIYNKNVNGVYYINSNLEPAKTSFSADNTGGDTRLRYPGSPGLFTAPTTRDQALRINDGVVQNIVLKNTNKGSVYSLTAKVEKPFSKGFYGSLAYNFAEAKDLGSAGTTAVTSFTQNSTVNGNNLPVLAYSDNDQRHRVVGALSYRLEYGGKIGGATSVTLFYEARNQGRNSYTYSSDLNGDGINNNDLLYVPSVSDIDKLTFAANSQNYTAADGTRKTITFTPTEQLAAYKAFVAQDEYLSSRRGQYTERNGLVRRWIYQADLSVVQEFFVTTGKKRNTIQLRADVYNVGNLLNKNWGVGQALTTVQPLAVASVSTAGVPSYRLATVTGADGVPALVSSTYRTSTTTNDVWRAQIGVRYIFN